MMLEERLPLNQEETTPAAVFWLTGRGDGVPSVPLVHGVRRRIPPSSQRQKNITTCGSGVTAAILMLALEVLGHRNASLYDGSWAEWGQFDQLKVETG